MFYKQHQNYPLILLTRKVSPLPILRNYSKLLQRCYILSFGIRSCLYSVTMRNKRNALLIPFPGQPLDIFVSILIVQETRNENTKQKLQTLLRPRTETQVPLYDVIYIFFPCYPRSHAIIVFLCRIAKIECQQRAFQLDVRESNYSRCFRPNSIQHIPAVQREHIQFNSIHIIVRNSFSILAECFTPFQLIALFSIMLPRHFLLSCLKVKDTLVILWHFFSIQFQ